MAVDPIDWALAYPFDVPTRSYILDSAGPRPLDDLPDLTGRHGVLASGSNQAPDQLIKKFSGRDWGAVYVLEAWIDGWDSVYSAHFSSYGAIPATLSVAPGVRTRFFVTWLSDRQLARMHETEALGQNYVYGRIADIEVRHHDTVVGDHVHAYFSKWGCLMMDGVPVSLAEIPATGRQKPALDQRAIQEVARRRLAPDRALVDFVSENICDIERRQMRTAQLAEGSAALPVGVHHIAP